MYTILLFKNIENKDNVYRDKDCMKRFCESLARARNAGHRFFFKKMKLLANGQQESYENTKTCKENFEYKSIKDKKYCKIRDHCHYKGEYRGT